MCQLFSPSVHRYLFYHNFVRESTRRRSHTDNNGIIIFVFFSLATLFFSTVVDVSTRHKAKMTNFDEGISIHHQQGKAISYSEHFLYSIIWHDIFSSMQIAILFIYNHCQLRNNIYLQRSFAFFSYCHLPQITTQ
jgi:hypothetical protein